MPYVDLAPPGEKCGLMLFELANPAACAFIRAAFAPVCTMPFQLALPVKCMTFTGALLRLTVQGLRFYCRATLC